MNYLRHIFNSAHMNSIYQNNSTVDNENIIWFTYNKEIICTGNYSNIQFVLLMQAVNCIILKL